jgi:hypothetical protein
LGVGVPLEALEEIPAAARIAYNASVDRLDAIRLLQALVAAGANSRAPMDSAWVDKIAVRDMWLHGMQLASAIAYAEAEGWLTDSRTRKGWVSLTRTGEAVAKAKLP